MYKTIFGTSACVAPIQNLRRWTKQFGATRRLYWRRRAPKKKKTHKTMKRPRKQGNDKEKHRKRYTNVLHAWYMCRCHYVHRGCIHYITRPRADRGGGGTPAGDRRGRGRLVRTGGDDSRRLRLPGGAGRRHQLPWMRIQICWRVLLCF